MIAALGKLLASLLFALVMWLRSQPPPGPPGVHVGYGSIAEEKAIADMLRRTHGARPQA